ncbi:ABC-F family ATP-binding cassette domain-containing protein [Geodermatophilus sabuli]|uniref:ATPase components of ABC transporters with duplicated ATPase domains n=1 Tax=Geodermatophilus sabuli TaxID=1564158 RepID=A0A285E5G7_9ACTN|nr:ATP-binding cassette domain-containing protein [Geodermatophilus sabuli]MBB3082805.1 ATPase subunit of ABC transporter with duplicated ATPase domains [Geodermatophilus sabuli]SNX94329.1 ATPase components of ABC transporters with duplicated ATPase domains [Geodermatophilus sabuli]
MGYVDLTGIRHTLPDGRVLLDDVSFRVGEGARAALVGENGAGKTTLLRIVAGDLVPEAGSIARSGGLGVMRQFIGSVRDDTTVQRFLVDLAPPAVRAAWEAVEAAELTLMETDEDAAQLAYADALGQWGDVGGYDAEVTWDAVTVAALGIPYERCKYRDLTTLSGGEQKRLALEALLRGPDQVLLLDEPDNYLDVPGKRWLEERLLETRKTVLFVSHDRELLARVADRVVTVEGGTAWVHGGGFAGYPAARSARHERMAELRRRWDEEHERLVDLVRTLQQQAANSPDMASRYRAMQTRLARFEAAGPPPDRPPEQQVAMRLRGGRTGVRAVMAEQLELTGLMRPFDLEVWYGDRVAVLGANGAGKSHFLRLLAGQDVPHSGAWRLGARVVPGFFAQTHAHPEWLERTLVDLLWHGEPGRPGVDRGRAMAALRRYGLADSGDQLFRTLSGGQQARFQVLLLEFSGATLLLLDEPTDNLDVLSAEALEEALAAFEGTVLGVTHDRWFARSFDRFLVFGADGRVYESPEPVFDEARVQRAR